MPRGDGDQAPQALNIRPGVAVIGLFPYMNYRPWYALGELVDNALASFITNRDRLIALDPAYRCRITIEVSNVDGGQIRVADNAAGIGTGDYQRAFVAAEPPPDSSGLSQFGIGMKSASCWFARRWAARTSALGESIERTVTFDVPEIVEQGIETLIPEERPAEVAAHYTELLLWDLHHPPQTRTLTKMEEHLASIYRVFLERGDVDITFNGRPLLFTQPRILVATPDWDPATEAIEWQKPIDFELPTGEHITGFAAIRETGSVAKAGLALFRHDRLIVGSDDDTYRPSEIFGSSNRFRYQRVFGELHLDGFEVSHTKDGFLWGDREQTFIELLRAELDAPSVELLRQAEAYRSRAATAGQRPAGAAALDGTAHALEGSGAELGTQVHAPPSGGDLPTHQPPVEDLEQRSLRVWVNGQAWDIDIELSSDPSVGEWVSIASTSPASDRPRQLEIRVALSHPFMLRFGGTTADDLEPLLRLAAGVALAEVTAREAGVSMAGTFRRNLNELLRGSLSNA
jgi:hypothetical protein